MKYKPGQIVETLDGQTVYSEGSQFKLIRFDSFVENKEVWECECIKSKSWFHRVGCVYPFSEAYFKKELINEYPLTKVHVFKKGDIHINHAIIYKYNPDMVLILVDCDKRVFPFGTGFNGNVDTIEICGYEDSDNFKSFSFPEFRDWSVFSISASKYTLKVCLIKKEN